MTKVKPRDFAHLLLDMTEKHSEANQKEYLKEFVALVFKKRMQGKIREIIAEYEILFNKTHGIVAAQITTAKRLDEKSLRSLALALKKQHSAKEIEVDEKVDQRLIGGVKVKVGDTIHDASLGHTLKALHKQLVA